MEQAPRKLLKVILGRKSRKFSREIQKTSAGETPRGGSREIPENSREKILKQFLQKTSKNRGSN